jgi:SAM-dependent methyltransferase
MNKVIQNHYSNLYQQYGNSPKSLQWSDTYSQFKRFKILSEIAKDVSWSRIIDIGCGLAHFLDYLKNQKQFNGEYLGLDFVSDFIIDNKKRFKNNKDTLFQLFDVAVNELPNDFDYIFISGIFNNKTNENADFLKNTITKAFNSTKKGVAFNLMSTYVDYMDEGLYYANPMEIFDYCKTHITKKITLRHDYLVKENTIPFEFTIYLYK